MNGVLIVSTTIAFVSLKSLSDTIFTARIVDSFFPKLLIKNILSVIPVN